MKQRAKKVRSVVNNSSQHFLMNMQSSAAELQEPKGPCSRRWKNDIVMFRRFFLFKGSDLLVKKKCLERKGRLSNTKPRLENVFYPMFNFSRTGTFKVMPTLVKEDGFFLLCCCCCLLIILVSGDFYSGPDTNTASVRDIYAKSDLGNFTGHFNATVAPMDALLLKFDFH